LLSSLYIKNYALIDTLNVSFEDKFTIITGETGAGKSILLGGLALVLGKRADLSQIKDKDQKCIIEASFQISNYQLQTVFKTLDLDYEAETIIRREILPSGKSRAFVNDTPTNLETLATLSQYLIDIHSQHQTQQLTDNHFQFKVIDALANNEDVLTEYTKTLQEYKQQKKSLEALIASKANLVKDYDYNAFLLQELNAIQLQAIDLPQLESDYETLNNVELIGEKLATTEAALNTEQLGVIDQLNTIKSELSKITSFSETYDKLWQRINSVAIELEDILSDLETQQEQLNSDPQALDQIGSQLKAINDLFQKHTVNTTEALIDIQTNLSQKVNDTESLDQDIETLQHTIAKLESNLNTLADQIRTNRLAIIPKLVQKLETILSELGMPNAKFKIQLEPEGHFLNNGTDRIQFLFMANKGSQFNALKKAASGGELSRIMLAIKSVMADYVKLPTIMFDEIDTGVSGEISNKIGAIMEQMSTTMQVFTITHLPQIAAKGHTHFKVFKTDINQQTQTQLKQLTTNERIVEIAQMLGGINPTASALTHQKKWYPEVS